MLSEAIEKLTLDAFSKVYGKEKYSNITLLNKLALELLSKSETDCNRCFEKCKNNIKILQQDFVSFSEKCSEKSEFCRCWDGLINLSTLLKSLIACDRNGDWEGHLQTVQKLLPVFRESDSISYLRYESFYVEKMPKLPIEHPDIYKKFLKVKLLVKTQIGNFNRLSPDMILEQTIQSSKKYAAGIIGQIRQLSYVTEWGLIYYEVVAISNVYQNIISGGLSFRETNLHHELGGSLYKLMNESVNKTYRFISERGNPYLTSQYVKLRHLTMGQCVNETDS